MILITAEQHSFLFFSRSTFKVYYYNPRCFIEPSLQLLLWCYFCDATSITINCLLMYDLILLRRFFETYLFCEYWLSASSHSLPPLILPLDLLLCLCDLSM
uniref:Uncharacterized protein n=1 Tax=Pyxicephalus adspersus TaxID=30357 RepID=A0AAV3AMI9_PYXAD|nr:TPA: hypothetical protein GDO54_008718 [Pyxicephalus adspersus]